MFGIRVWFTYEHSVSMCDHTMNDAVQTVLNQHTQTFMNIIAKRQRLIAYEGE